MKIIALIFFLSVTALAQVKVAFLESMDSKGHRVELEPGSRFSHVALSYKGQWLQAHPYWGVEVVSTKDLELLGKITVIIDFDDRDEPSDAFVHSILGTPYDSTYSWDSKNFYCSKLVGKFLGLRPEPMRFNPDFWPKEYQKLNGQLGLSPDGVYRQLIQ